jgi:hypothetical protein
MKTLQTLSLVSVLSLLAPALALADEPDSVGIDREVEAPSNAFEITVGTGYSQGGGEVGGGMQHLEDISGPGGAFELELGYRINPTWLVGAYGSFSAYDNADLEDGSSVLGATAGLFGAAHLRPDRSVDPWVSLGAGWKALWLTPDRGKDTSLQGFELARLRIGVDYRINKHTSISPEVGGSLGMFVSQDSPMTTDYTEISDKKVNFTGFAGVAGRFDIGI